VKHSFKILLLIFAFPVRSEDVIQPHDGNELLLAYGLLMLSILISTVAIAWQQLKLTKRDSEKGSSESYES